MQRFILTMNFNDTLLESSLTSLPLVAKGKVRDIYEIDDHHLLIVTTDRISAFDVILDTPIPEKGKVLTRISNFWFERIGDLIPNHTTDLSLAQVLPDAEERNQVEGRAIIVKKLRPLPIEAIVRGYLIGSGWKDYQASGQICGIDLPANLQLASKLEQPIYTPSTKAAIGDHDENISFAQTVDLIGEELATQVRDVAIAIYQTAADFAATKGIIIADTKLEFGLDSEGKLHLIDEALTPDSSRFWPKDQYQAGINPPSYDKQIVRDYLSSLDWDKTPPAPSLPTEIITHTANKYWEALHQLID